MTSSVQKVNSVNGKDIINKKGNEAVKHTVEIPVKLNYNTSISHDQVDPAVRHTVELRVNLAFDIPIDLQTNIMSTDVKNIEDHNLLMRPNISFEICSCGSMEELAEGLEQQVMFL